MANKSLRVTIKNDRIQALEARMGAVEQYFAQKLAEFTQALGRLQGEIQGLKDNELEHIYGEMQKMAEFQAELKGSIKAIKDIIFLVLGLLGTELPWDKIFVFIAQFWK